jgi:hypothetical protein
VARNILLGRIGPKPTQEWRPLHVVCFSGSHVSSVQDFSSITLLFSEHTLDTSVPENNRVTLSKSRMEDTRESENQTTCIGRHSVAVQKMLDNSGTTHLTSYCEVHRSRTGDA